MVQNTTREKRLLNHSEKKIKTKGYKPSYRYYLVELDQHQVGLFKPNTIHISDMIKCESNKKGKGKKVTKYHYKKNSYGANILNKKMKNATRQNYNRFMLDIANINHNFVIVTTSKKQIDDNVDLFFFQQRLYQDVHTDR